MIIIYIILTESDALNKFNTSFQYTYVAELLNTLYFHLFDNRKR